MLVVDRQTLSSRSSHPLSGLCKLDDLQHRLRARVFGQGSDFRQCAFELRMNYGFSQGNDECPLRKAAHCIAILANSQKKNLIKIISYIREEKVSSQPDRNCTV